jgi:hypothetical protein
MIHPRSRLRERRKSTGWYKVKTAAEIETVEGVVLIIVPSG